MYVCGHVHTCMCVCICIVYAFALYGTITNNIFYIVGPVTVTLVTPQYQVYYSDETINARMQVRGEFYDIVWYYHPTDPLAGSVGRTALFTTAGVGSEFFRQGVNVASGTSTVHAAGYFVPEIEDTQFTTRSIVADESTLYRAYGECLCTVYKLNSNQNKLVQYMCMCCIVYDHITHPLPSSCTNSISPHTWYTVTWWGPHSELHSYWVS